jgi:hypothetical protein
MVSRKSVPLEFARSGYQESLDESVRMLAGSAKILAIHRA